MISCVWTPLECSDRKDTKKRHQFFLPAKRVEHQTPNVFLTSLQKKKTGFCFVVVFHRLHPGRTPQKKSLEWQRSLLVLSIINTDEYTVQLGDRRKTLRGRALQRTLSITTYCSLLSLTPESTSIDKPSDLTYLSLTTLLCSCWAWEYHPPSWRGLKFSKLFSLLSCRIWSWKHWTKRNLAWSEKAVHYVSGTIRIPSFRLSHIGSRVNPLPRSQLETSRSRRTRNAMIPNPTKAYSFATRLGPQCPVMLTNGILRFR